jgi:pyruvate-ferredoxin/flavodoxin oxidoreductase
MNRGVEERAGDVQEHRFARAGVQGLKFTLQVAAEDCTGCALCVDVCPARNKTEASSRPSTCVRRRRCARRSATTGIFPGCRNWTGANQDDPAAPAAAPAAAVRIQRRVRRLRRDALHQMLTQLFGDRAVIANATGCSSIYGGNLPTTPYAKNKCGRGPTWCNSLFEDNAEFGLGFRVSIDKQKEFADRTGEETRPATRRRFW